MSAVESLSAHTSAQGARASQATEDIVRNVDYEFGMLTATEAGLVLGSVSKASRGLASTKHRNGELLGITKGRQMRFPGFQFLEDGTPRPVIRMLRSMCNDCGWSESDLFLWLVTPAAAFSGSRPVDVMLAPKQDNLLIEAARTEMSAEW
jgi:hypothetical protein